MNKKGIALSTEGKRPPPVRVRLKRISCDQAQAHPPDGQSEEWWHRLKSALGTASSAFVDASLTQLVAAARLPGRGISEVAVNVALAFIDGAKPREEVECALVIQMGIVPIDVEIGEAALLTLSR